MYASHADALIYSYYSSILSDKYEDLIRDTNTAITSIAYRRFPDKKSNITFAKEAFDFIMQEGNCIALAYDVTDFFGTLNHEILKANWIRVLGHQHEKLPADHYAVYRSLAKFCFVDRKALMNALGVTKKDQLRKDRFCDISEFRTLVRNKHRLINKNPNTDKGIPQGSSVSAVLSNIYMIDFDERLSDLACQLNAFYRRYCDDIIFVCKPEVEWIATQAINHELLHLNLNVNGEKKDVSEFAISNGRQQLIAQTKPLQYLGFVFDGEKIVIRSPSMARYYRKLKAGVRAARNEKKFNRLQRMNKKLLYGRYSSLGKKNFISYVKRASNEMASVEMLRQIRKHWPVLLREMDK